MKTRREYGAAYLNSMRRFDWNIFFCETDRKENNGMKFIDAEDCVSIDIMMVTDIMEDDVRKTAR